jgi:hypothetical protein
MVDFNTSSGDHDCEDPDGDRAFMHRQPSHRRKVLRSSNRQRRTIIKQRTYAR